MLELSDVNVFKFKQLLDGLQLILESDIRVSIHVTEISIKHGFIRREIHRDLVSEFEALVQLHLEDYLGGEDHPGNKTIEVLRDVTGVNSLDFTIGHFSHRANGIDVTFGSDDGHYMDCDTFALGVLSALSIKFSALILSPVISYTS